MSHSPQLGSSHASAASAATWREASRETVRYWERRRFGYNGVLLAVTVVWLVGTWPHFRPALNWSSGLQLLGLAALANACYCAAYPLDFILLRSPLREMWRRRRWVLWCAGTLFAVVLTCYWIADEIYPSVG